MTASFQPPPRHRAPRLRRSPRARLGRELTSRSHRAAMAYLSDDQLTLAATDERFDVHISSVCAAVKRERERRRVWPEDEVTL